MCAEYAIKYRCHHNEVSLRVCPDERPCQQVESKMINRSSFFCPDCFLRKSVRNESIARSTNGEIEIAKKVMELVIEFNRRIDNNNGAFSAQKEARIELGPKYVFNLEHFHVLPADSLRYLGMLSRAMDEIVWAKNYDGLRISQDEWMLALRVQLTEQEFLIQQDHSEYIYNLELEEYRERMNEITEDLQEFGETIAEGNSTPADIQTLPEDSRECIVCTIEFGKPSPENLVENPRRTNCCKQVIGESCLALSAMEKLTCPFCRAPHTGPQGPQRPPVPNRTIPRDAYWMTVLRLRTSEELENYLRSLEHNGTLAGGLDDNLGHDFDDDLDV